MDLQYLLFLQNNIRNDSLTPIMMGVSDFAISFWLMAAIFCVFWCFNKKAGYFMMTSYCITSILNSTVKLSFCIYRPWIRDPQIIPAGNAIKTAGGYSFPSGHTQIITAGLGSGAVLTWLKQKWISVIFVVMILLVAFSRNYLGVHTPQDVIVGIILGILSICCAYKLQNRDNQDKKSDIKLLTYGLIIGITAILYFVFKNYPITYDAAGKIIVDPQKMIKDGFLSVGIWLGFIIGWFIEKNYINFSTDCSLQIKVTRAFIGVGSLYLVFYKIGSLFYTIMPSAHIARLFQWFFMVFYVMVIYPLIFKNIEKLISKPKTEIQNKE